MEIRVLRADDVVHWGRPRDGVIHHSTVSKREFGLGCRRTVLLTNFFGIMARSAWRRWVVNLLNVWFFHEGQEGKLGGVSDDRYEQYVIARHHQSNAIISSISNRIHWMSEKLVK